MSEDMNDVYLEHIHPQVLPVEEVKVVEPEFKSTLTPEQLADAQATVAGRSFSGRHPELGKMINCKVCGRRHRETDITVKKFPTDEGIVRSIIVVRPKCEQKFTYTAQDRVGRKYAQFHEEEKDGEVIVTPLYRTAMESGKQPTIKQVIGAAAFNKKRFKPHPSKTKFAFIATVRDVFKVWEDQFNQNLTRVNDDELREKLEAAYEADAQNMMHRARYKAARILRKAGFYLKWGTK